MYLTDRDGRWAADRTWSGLWNINRTNTVKYCYHDLNYGEFSIHLDYSLKQVRFVET